MTFQTGKKKKNPEYYTKRMGKCSVTIDEEVSYYVADPERQVAYQDMRKESEMAQAKWAEMDALKMWRTS